MRIGYADPPYPGYAKKYKDHPDYAGEVDHLELLVRLDSDYDGWVLHTGSVNLVEILAYTTKLDITDFRVMAWVKPFAAFKPNVPVAYAWEPVLVKPVRPPVVSDLKTGVMRDWYSHNITLRKGLTGAKPEALCWWLFDVLGASNEDDLDDMYPGTGAVSVAWETWKQRRLDLAEEGVSGVRSPRKGDLRATD